MAPTHRRCGGCTVPTHRGCVVGRFAQGAGAAGRSGEGCLHVEPPVRCSSLAALAPVPGGSFPRRRAAACQRPRPATGLAAPVRGGQAGLAQVAARRRPALLRQGHQRPADHLPRRHVPGLGPDGGGTQPAGAGPDRLHMAFRAARQGDPAGGRPARDAGRPAGRAQPRHGRRAAAAGRQLAVRGRGRRVRPPHPPGPGRLPARPRPGPDGVVGAHTWGALVSSGRMRSQARC
jgi:hypothetical protein